MLREKAIEIIRNIYQQTDADAEKEALAMFIPELKESEDERIGRSLIEYFSKFNPVDMWDDNFSFSQILAYLKKQKEPSVSAIEVLERAGLKPYKDGDQWCILAGDNIQEGICGFGGTIGEALYQFLMEVLETQKEWKPAKWSEEDEELWTDIKRRMINVTFIASDKIAWLENKLNSFSERLNKMTDE